LHHVLYIQSYLISPTSKSLHREPKQIKSHGQRELRKMRQGVDIFHDLDQAELEGTAPPTPPCKFRFRSHMRRRSSIITQSTSSSDKLFDSSRSMSKIIQEHSATDEFLAGQDTETLSAAIALCQLTVNPLSNSDCTLHRDENIPPQLD
jgi:hypothetical protein